MKEHGDTVNDPRSVNPIINKLIGEFVIPDTVRVESRVALNGTLHRSQYRSGRMTSQEFTIMMGEPLTLDS